MNIINRKTFDNPLSMMPGDTINVIYRGLLGESILMTHHLTDSLNIDAISIMKVDNELGFSNALAVVFGEASDARIS